MYILCEKYKSKKDILFLLSYIFKSSLWIMNSNQGMNDWWEEGVEIYLGWY